MSRLPRLSVRSLAAACAGLALILSTVALLGSAQDTSKKKRSAKKEEGPPAVGYDDTPFLPDGKWRVHDIARPHPPLVTPGAKPGDPPSDAIVLFDGKDLSKWAETNAKGETGAPQTPRWKVENGYFEVVPNTGHIYTKEKFGDCQLHIEWATPAQVRSSSQLRGNSGVLLMSRYEIQVLDSWENLTYADGQAGSIYGQYPPLANVARRPGEWQSYDIVFEAPKFEADKVAKPAHFTVFHNGVLMHNRQAAVGRMAHKIVGTYAPHSPEEPLMLQNHGDPVRFRNVWIRRLKGYDQQ
jgi:hypothetical protein